MRIKLALEVLGFVALALLVVFVPRFVGDFTAYELAIVGMYFIALLGLVDPHRLRRPDLARARRVHGDRRLHDGDSQRATTAVRDLWTIPIAGLVAGGGGLLVGIPALRLSGLYLALITFGIAVSFPQLPKKFDHFFGGTTGKVLNLVKPPFGLDATPNHWLYYLTWGIAFVLLVAGVALPAREAGSRPAGDPRQ